MPHAISHRDLFFVASVGQVNSWGFIEPEQISVCPSSPILYANKTKLRQTLGPASLRLTGIRTRSRNIYDRVQLPLCDVKNEVLRG